MARNEDGPGETKILIPVDPLEAAIEIEARKYGGELCILFRGHKPLAESYYRAVARGSITMALADRICTRVLACHPAQVYDEDWYEF